PSVATPAARWVAPNNGECPAGYPIKVNEDSGIYHVPGGRFYARTAADRCYANADDALADGYRPAKA
ncbi:MAG: sunset domain-containing protein, partial [Ilumatobacteraceae bacterium]